MERSFYPTDLTDAQWKLIKPLIPPADPGGRERSVDMREVVNGILYLNRNGCTWRSLPHEFPPWGTVWYYFRRFRNDGTWKTPQRIVDRLRLEPRVGTSSRKRILTLSAKFRAPVVGWVTS